MRVRKYSPHRYTTFPHEIAYCCGPKRVHTDRCAIHTRAYIVNQQMGKIRICDRDGKSNLKMKQRSFVLVYALQRLENGYEYGVERHEENCTKWKNSIHTHTRTHTNARPHIWEMETRTERTIGYLQFSTFFMCCSVANALKQMCELKTLSQASKFISSAEKSFFLRSSALISLQTFSRLDTVFLLRFSAQMAAQHIPPLVTTIRYAVQARTRSAHTLFFGLSTQEWSSSSSSSTSSLNYMTNEKLRIFTSVQFASKFDRLTQSNRFFLIDQSGKKTNDSVQPPRNESQTKQLCRRKSCVR